MEVGDIVKIKPPFNNTYTSVYKVVSVEQAEDDSVTYFLEGIEGGFSEIYLEKI